MHLTRPRGAEPHTRQRVAPGQIEWTQPPPVCTFSTLPNPKRKTYRNRPQRAHLNKELHPVLIVCAVLFLPLPFPAVAGQCAYCDLCLATKVDPQE